MTQTQMGHFCELHLQDKLEIKWLKCIIFVWLATIYYTREKNEQNENGSAEKFPKTFTWRTLILTVQ